MTSLHLYCCWGCVGGAAVTPAAPSPPLVFCELSPSQAIYIFLLYESLICIAPLSIVYPHAYYIPTCVLFSFQYVSLTPHSQGQSVRSFPCVRFLVYYYYHYFYALLFISWLLLSCTVLYFFLFMFFVTVMSMYVTCQRPELVQCRSVAGPAWLCRGAVVWPRCVAAARRARRAASVVPPLSHSHSARVTLRSRPRSHCHWFLGKTRHDDECTARHIDWLIDWTLDWLIIWLVDWSVNWKHADQRIWKHV